MRPDGIKISPKLLLVLLPLLGSAACVEYTLDTTLNADGSGVRTESVRAEENDGSDPSAEDFVDVMHLSGAEGWSHARDVDDDGDSIHVFRRRQEVRDLDGWGRLTGQMRVSAATRRTSGTRMGYVRLGDVAFSNEVLVVTGRGSDGSRAYTYRETFRWHHAVDVIVEFFMERVDEALETRYPRLTERERGEIVGFARARLWHAVDNGLILADGAQEDELITGIIDHTVPHTVEILRLRYPGEGGEFVEALMNRLFREDDEWIGEVFERQAPGLNLAFNTSVVFRLTMPGRVTDTNAHEREGSTLVGKFDLTDAMPDEIQVFAQSMVEEAP